MNAKCCDRCGKFYRGAKPEGEELILGTYTPAKTTALGAGVFQKDEDRWEQLDLCPACYKQLYKWLKREKSRPRPPAVEVPELNGGFIFN